MEIIAPKVKRQYNKRSADQIFMAKVHGMKRMLKQHTKAQKKADKLKSRIKRAKASLLKGF